MLFNNWYTPIAIICCVGYSYYTSPLVMTHFGQNNIIEIMVSTIFVYDLDLAYCDDWSILLSVKKKILIFGWRYCLE